MRSLCHIPQSQNLLPLLQLAFRPWWWSQQPYQQSGLLPNLLQYHLQYIMCPVQRSKKSPVPQHRSLKEENSHQFPTSIVLQWNNSQHLCSPNQPVPHLPSHQQEMIVHGPTLPASTNVFVARSWPISQNGNEILIPAFIKIEERPNAESAPPKQAAIPHSMVLGNSAENNKSLTNAPSEELCGWGPQCPICAQSNPNLKQKILIGRKRIVMDTDKKQRRKRNKKGTPDEK